MESETGQSGQQEASETPQDGGVLPQGCLTVESVER